MHQQVAFFLPQKKERNDPLLSAYGFGNMTFYLVFQKTFPMWLDLTPKKESSIRKGKVVENNSNSEKGRTKQRTPTKHSLWPKSWPKTIKI